MTMPTHEQMEEAMQRACKEQAKIMEEGLETRIKCLELRTKCLELQVQMLERKDFRATCSSCGSPNGKLWSDPIAKVLRGTDEPVILCDECYRKREIEI